MTAFPCVEAVLSTLSRQCSSLPKAVCDALPSVHKGRAWLCDCPDFAPSQAIASLRKITGFQSVSILGCLLSKAGINIAYKLLSVGVCVQNILPLSSIPQIFRSKLRNAIYQEALSYEIYVDSNSSRIDGTLSCG